MAINTDAERAEFEAWARDQYPSIDLARDGDGYSRFLENDYWSLWQAARRTQAAPVPAQEPFGYFKAEPFGWRDCAETDEGAVALYEAPQPQADAPVALPEHGINTASHDGYMNGEQPMKAKSHNTYIVGVIADKIEDGTLFDSGIYRRREIAEIVRNLLSTVIEFQADALDAQRYRWLRAQPLESDMFCTTIWRKGTDGFGDDLRLEELDAAIDAAIAAAKEMK